MTTADDLRFLDATAQAALVRRGEVSAPELVDAAIARIERVDPALNAVVIRDLRGGPAGGPAVDLPTARSRGVPFLLKDLGATQAGLPYLPGQPRLQRRSTTGSRRTPSSAPASARAGLVTLGKTNLPELGSSPTTQPASFGPDPQPVGPDPLAGRLQRWGGRGGRRRAGAGRPRQRRRRLDPAAGVLVRPGRAEAEPGSHAVARVDRPPDRRAGGQPVRAGHRRRARRHPRLRRPPTSTSCAPPAGPTWTSWAGTRRRCASRCSPTAAATTSIPSAWWRPTMPPRLLEGHGPPRRAGRRRRAVRRRRQGQRLAVDGGRSPATSTASASWPAARSPPRRSSRTTGRRPSGTAR